MKRRGFLGGLIATAAGLWLPDPERLRAYSFLPPARLACLDLYGASGVRLARCERQGEGFEDWSADATGTVSHLVLVDALGRPFGKSVYGDAWTMNTRSIVVGANIVFPSFKYTPHAT
jgi:hypothetical protein